MTPLRASNLKNAIQEWQSLLGTHGVLLTESATQGYGPDTTPRDRPIVAALRPTAVEQVASIVRIACRHGVPLHPVSTGCNWGYGSARPLHDDAVVLDLSGLDRIVDFDEDLGLVTLQPGVTQGQLSEYLRARGLGFLVPVHGGGPSCSVLGNALDRGYGITPHIDHFGAVTAVEAVLPDGELYRTPLSELGGQDIDRAFKWGLGPYLDGIFSQGSFGVVTQMTLALARRPERIEAFFFQVEDSAQLPAVVEAVRTIVSTLGGNLGGINLMNDLRVLSMSVPYPFDRVRPGEAMSEDVIADLRRQWKIAPWLGTGAIYGTREVVAAVRAGVRRALRGLVKRLTFVSDTAIGRAQTVLHAIPEPFRPRLSRMVDRAAGVFELLAGVPNETALPLAYWKRRQPAPTANLNPARDRCGLLWHAPLVPLKPDRVQAYVRGVESVCRAHGIDALLTLTVLNDRCIDSTVPVLFDPDSHEETVRAHACHAALFDEGRAEGFIPYRVGPRSMDWIVRPESSFFRLVSKLKGAVDPAGILDPGRYALAPANDDPAGAVLAESGTYAALSRASGAALR